MLTLTDDEQRIIEQLRRVGPIHRIYEVEWAGEGINTRDDTGRFSALVLASNRDEARAVVDEMLPADYQYGALVECRMLGISLYQRADRPRLIVTNWAKEE
jgi:hypothetical protein